MENRSNPAGRPKGRKKTAKIEVTIEPAIKERFMKMLSANGMTASGQICNWIREYLKTYEESKAQ